MGIAVLAIAAVIVAGALFTVATVGQVRKPVTPGTAVIIVIIDTAMAAMLVTAALRLGFG